MSLGRLIGLRWLTMLGYSTCYVVIPALIFERTRSAAFAGAALVVEGMIRAALALLAGPVHGRLGSRGALGTAEVLRLVAITLLACSLLRFSLVLVVLASLLYQFGFSLLVLEQELRCAQLGDRIAQGQVRFRRAELGVVPLVLLAAVGGQRMAAPYWTLLAVAAGASVAQLALAWHWLPRSSVQQPAQPMRMGPTLRYLQSSPLTMASMAASVISFAFYGWAVFAAPFLVQGRELFAVPLDSPGGTALFKSLLALSGLASLLVWARLLQHSSSARVVTAVSVALPLLFWLGLKVPATALAVVFISLGCIAHFGLISWQRARRQHTVPQEYRQGLTALYLSFETLGVSLTGVILLSDRPATACAIAAVTLILLLVPSLRSELKTARPLHRLSSRSSEG